MILAARPAPQPEAVLVLGGVGQLLGRRQEVLEGGGRLQPVQQAVQFPYIAGEPRQPFHRRYYAN